MRSAPLSNAIIFLTIYACAASAAPPIPAVEELGPYGAVLNFIEPWEMPPIPRAHAFPQTDRQCADTRPGAIDSEKACDLAVSGHIAEAIQKFSVAIKQSPSDPSWHLSRAKLYIKVSEEAFAKADLRAAISSNQVDVGRQFEIEQSLIRLGDYQTAEETIPGILLANSAGPVVLRAQFEYLLACSQEQRGQDSIALEKYLTSATQFMIAGRPVPATLCVKRANAIASRTSSNLPAYSLASLVPPRKEVESVKIMMAHLVSHSDCFRLSTVQQETGATLTEQQPGRFYERPPFTHFTSIGGVSLKSIPGKEQLLEVGINPSECCLSLTDLEPVLGRCKRVPAPEIGWLTFLDRVAYAVPSGTLIVDSNKEGFRAIQNILLYRRNVRRQ